MARRALGPRKSDSAHFFMLSSLNESSGDPNYDPVMANFISKKFSGLSAPLIGSMASIVIGSMASIVIGSMACLLCRFMACLLCGSMVCLLCGWFVSRLASLAIAALW